MPWNDAVDLDEGEEVGCYICMLDPHLRSHTYHRGEAFLCGPGHTPCNGDANYICMEHLDDDVTMRRDGVDAHPSQHYPENADGELWDRVEARAKAA